MAASNAMDVDIYGDEQSDYFSHFWSRTYRQVTDYSPTDNRLSADS